MHTSKLLFVSLSLLFAITRANAALKFEQTEIELHPSYNDQSAVASFKYKNTGDRPVHIAGVHTSCGCTVASLKSNDVAPGDTGEITATFNIGGRTGAQEKKITVQTDDPAAPTTVLTLKATIPKLLEMRPAFVYWQGKEPLEPKFIDIKAPGDSPVTKLSVRSSDPEFDVSVVPDPKQKKQWKIKVVPKDNTRMHSATLTIQPDYPKKSPKLFYATARVLTAPQAAAAAAPAPAKTQP